MNSLTLLLISIIIVFIAYVTYGAWLTKKLEIDPSIPTPAHTHADGVDFVASKPQVLLGHHFASIAGSGPIVGPIQAVIFGWIPVVLWIIIGGIFFGGVHDYGSLVGSIKHDGKSIGKIIESNMGHTGKLLFNLFAWLTLLLVVAAFANIVATTFVAVPAAATSSLLFILLAIIFGFFVYRKGVSLGIATIFGIVGLAICIYLGSKFPINLPVNFWIGFIAVYICVASVIPVWILLQPRDYLNSFLLYAMIIGAFVGLLVYRPEIQISGYTGFSVETATGIQYLFPILFITVACGAISGFHSLVGSGTSSKQINNEKDAKLIGYGGMLIESILAIIAVITAAYLTKDKFSDLLTAGGPVNVFSDGIATFMATVGVPFGPGKAFISLAVSAFALTSLDTATRLARFIFQEFFEKADVPADKQSILTNKYVATIITVALGTLLAIGGYEKIWPIFGSANQLLAALALLALAVWMKNKKKNYFMFFIPMLFMFAATLTALVFLVRTNLANANYILVVIAIALFILALFLAKSGYDSMFGKKRLEK